MPLSQAVDPAAESTTPFLLAERTEVPEEIPRGRGGRPKIRELIVDDKGVMSESTVRFTSYTRASTLGKGIKSEFNLTRWKLRAVTFGLSRYPALVLKAASAAGMEEQEDKDLLDEVAEEAKERAGAGDAAMSGTALHKLSERMDAGEDLSWLPDYALAALQTYRRLMAALEIIGAEQFVVCDDLGAGGSYDRLVVLKWAVKITWKDQDNFEHTEVLPAGTRLILDLKTNKTTAFWGPEYLAQQVVYSHGIPYSAAGGRGHWPDGIQPNVNWALILHVPVMSPVDAGFYWVPLRAGRVVAELANAVRGWQNSADLFLPTDLEPHEAATPEDMNEGVREVVMDLITGAGSEAELDRLYDEHEDIWTDEHSAAARARLHDLYSDDPHAARPAEKPMQVRVLELAAAVRKAADEDELTALWTEHEDIWADVHGQLAKARMAELRAGVPAS